MHNCWNRHRTKDIKKYLTLNKNIFENVNLVSVEADRMMGIYYGTIVELLINKLL